MKAQTLNKKLKAVRRRFESKVKKELASKRDYINVTTLHWHEALDRVGNIMLMMDTLILNHPAVRQHGKVYKQAFEAAEKMADLYQMIGRMRFSHKG